MKKDILEKAGEIIKKTRGIFLEKLTNQEKIILIDIDALRPKYKLSQLLIFQNVVAVILRNNLLRPISTTMCVLKLLIFLKKVNVATAIDEYMRH